MYSIANSTSYMFFRYKSSKYFKIYTIQKTLPKWELMKISLFASFPLPAPNNIAPKTYYRPPISSFRYLGTWITTSKGEIQNNNSSTIMEMQ